MYLSVKEHQQLLASRETDRKACNRRLQREQGPPDTLIPDLQPLKLGYNEFLFFKPPVCGHLFRQVQQTYTLLLCKQSVLKAGIRLWETTVQKDCGHYALFICLTQFTSSRCYCFQHSASPSPALCTERILTKVINPPVLFSSTCGDGGLPHSTWRLNESRWG